MATPLSWKWKTAFCLQFYINHFILIENINININILPIKISLFFCQLCTCYLHDKRITKNRLKHPDYTKCKIIVFNKLSFWLHIMTAVFCQLVIKKLIYATKTIKIVIQGSTLSCWKEAHTSYQAWPCRFSTIFHTIQFQITQNKGLKSWYSSSVACYSHNER